MRNQSGQSIVQVLVAAAIMGIMVLAMQSMFTMMNRETMALSEKLAALDLEKVLIASLADGSVCQYVMSPASTPTFNSASAISIATPATIVLASSPSGGPATLYTSYTPANGSTPEKVGAVVAQVGQTVSPGARNLQVARISLQVTGAGSGTNIFKGNWLIEFDESKLVRSLRPVSVATTITADVTNPAAAKVKGCQGTGSSSGAGGDGSWCGAFLGVDDFGSGPSVNKIIYPCKGNTTLSCPAGTTFKLGACIDGGGVIHPYDSSTVCPSGYKLVNLFQVTDPSGTGNLFFTCTPN